MGDFNNSFNSDFKIMNKQEILALIDAKIKGQGTAVDAGSVLPDILNGIIDLIPTVQPLTRKEVFDLVSVKTNKTDSEIVAAAGVGLSKGAACQALGISTSDLDAIMAGEIVRFVYGDGSIAVYTQTATIVWMGDLANFQIVIEYDVDAGTYDIIATLA